MQSVSALSRLLRVATDIYRLRAQLLPALLVVLPWFAILFPNHPLDPRRMLVTATLALGVGGLWSVGLMWFLGLVVHACGHRRRRQLFRGRGQRPAIRMLRHRDPTVDPATKQAWREQLARRWSVRLPTQAEERAHPAKADTMYERAVTCCERHTLDHIASPALWQECLECEFLMNGLALRWIGLASAAAAALCACIDRSSMNIKLQPRWEITASLSLSSETATAVLISASLALAWLYFFTPKRARSAARSYDLHLLESAATDIKPHRAHSPQSARRKIR